jgi:inhibitor of KinA
MPDTPKIFPLGVGALTVDFGNEISVELNERAISLAAYFDANPFPGFIESVPAYASCAIYFDPIVTRKSFPDFATASDAVRSFIESALANLVSFATGGRSVEIPVDFGSGAALDLAQIAEHGEMSESDAIKTFISRSYRVYMIGFLPGFAYMGEVEDSIATPRRSSPRLKVPKGSVGIAGRQTGIYSLESPGGWQIIGRTDVDMFTPQNEPPSLLKAGDQVTFVSI